MPETVGPRTLGVKIINAYLAKLLKAADHDPVAALAFHRVGNLLAAPPSLMHSRIAARVLWGNLRPQAPHAAAHRRVANANAAQ
jgi:hypothetical protein